MDFLLNRPPGVTLWAAIKALLADASLTWTNKTLTDPRIGPYIKDTNGNNVLYLAGAVDATTHFQLSNSAGSTVYFKVVGDGSHLNLVFQPKGNGVNRFADGNGLLVLATKAGVASAVNYVDVQNAATGSGPTFSAAGSDTDIDLNLAGKGAGLPRVAAIKFAGGSGTATARAGAGSPEGVVTATPGSAYLDTNGGAGATLYIKESGTGNTGWAAK